MSTFAAIDFETANHDPASACAVGIVIATDGRIVHREHHLIRPPTRFLDALDSIFDIGGNQWRLATDVNFRTGRVYLRWFGKHAEYDKVDWRNFP